VPNRFSRDPVPAASDRFSLDRVSPRGADHPLGFTCTKTQLIREAEVKAAIETALATDFVPVVTRIGEKGGRKVMWTSLPDSIKDVFGLTEMFTQDGWKQKSMGDRPIDISAYSVKDEVKMVCQSVGLGGKHAIVRGIPATPTRKESIRLSGLAAKRKKNCYMPPALRKLIAAREAKSSDLEVQTS